MYSRDWIAEIICCCMATIAASVIAAVMVCVLWALAGGSECKNNTECQTIRLNNDGTWNYIQELEKKE